ncbi:MAG: hypothetical protein EPN21_13170 [Methylococcaceae bacterium]|nr:MAG: hypothetical protein EPN21_13170 [Methylococcaceae bacterium]
MNGLPVEVIESFSTDGFLDPVDLTGLLAISAALQDVYQKRQIWRTETEMRMSVLDDLHYPTNAAKYWQAVREQSVFLANLTVLSFDYRRNNIEIRRLQSRLGRAQPDSFDRELLQVDLDECLFKQKDMELAAKDRAREILLWEKIKTELDDGSFDTADVNSHQLVSYTQSLILRKLSAGDSGNPGERQNLDGQLQTSLRLAHRSGVLDMALEPFQASIKQLAYSLAQ